MFPYSLNTLIPDLLEVYDVLKQHLGNLKNLT